MAGITSRLPHPSGIYFGFGKQISSPSAFTASTLTTEPSLQLQDKQPLESLYEKTDIQQAHFPWVRSRDTLETWLGKIIFLSHFSKYKITIASFSSKKNMQKCPFILKNRQTQFICMSICLQLCYGHGVCAIPKEARRGHSITGCWWLILGPLQELITPEPSLQSESANFGCLLLSMHYSQTLASLQASGRQHLDSPDRPCPVSHRQEYSLCEDLASQRMRLLSE